MVHFKHKKINGVILNVNVRKEKHGPETKVLGLDVKMQVNVPVNAVNMLAIDEDVDFGAFMHTQNGELRGLGLGESPVLKFAREYKDHGVCLTVDGEDTTFNNCIIKGISVEFLPGKRALIDYTFQAHPTDEEAEVQGPMLMKMLQETVSVKVFPQTANVDVEEVGEKEEVEA